MNLIIESCYECERKVKVSSVILSQLRSRGQCLICDECGNAFMQMYEGVSHNSGLRDRSILGPIESWNLNGKTSLGDYKLA